MLPHSISRRVVCCWFRRVGGTNGTLVGWRENTRTLLSNQDVVRSRIRIAFARGGETDVCFELAPTISS